VQLPFSLTAFGSRLLAWFQLSILAALSDFYAPHFPESPDYPNSPDRPETKAFISTVSFIYKASTTELYIFSLQYNRNILCVHYKRVTYVIVV
jgi:hypothetical protein